MNRVRYPTDYEPRDRLSIVHTSQALGGVIAPAYYDYAKAGPDPVDKRRGMVWELEDLRNMEEVNREIFEENRERRLRYLENRHKRMHAEALDRREANETGA